MKKYNESLLNLLQHANATAKVLKHVMALEFVIATQNSTVPHAWNASQGTMAFHIAQFARTPYDVQL